MNLGKRLLIFIHIGSLLFIFIHVSNYIKKVSGVVGTLTLQEGGNTFNITPTLAANGSLTASTTYWLRVAVYDSGGTAILMSPKAQCVTDTSNKQCTLTWQTVASNAFNNYKVFYSTTASDLNGGTSGISYKQSSPVTTASLTFSDTTATGTAAVPAESTDSQINKFSGINDWYILESGKKIGFGTKSPGEEVEVTGNVLFNFNKTFTNATTPTGNSDLATKAFVKTQCETYCGGASFCP